MVETTYIKRIRRTARYGPQGFIKDLDQHATLKIAHKIAFRVYKHDLFEQLWHREHIVEEPETELAVRWLSNDHCRESAKAMIAVWWHIHNIEPCEVTLYMAVEEAWELTAALRERYLCRKEEERAYGNTQFVLDYLLEHSTASAAGIAQATGIDRKALNQTFGRLYRSGQLERVSRGAYRLRGDKSGL